MASVFYGNNLINGREVAVEPGSRVVLGDGGNAVEVESYQLWYHKLPWQTFIGGAGVDQFYGGSGTFRGRGGNDLFRLSGDMGEVIAHGGAGHDSFYTPGWGSIFHGGGGKDFWTNLNGLVPQAGRHDRAFLGNGGDIASVVVTYTSSADGDRIQDRLMELDGGPGQDRLLMRFDGLLPGQVFKGGARTFDFSRADTETIAYGNFTATGFENYALAILPDLADRVVFAHGGDLLDMHGPRDRRADVRIEGRGGDDTLLGPSQGGEAFLFGGQGDDVLRAGEWSRPAPGWRDRLFGGEGDDLLFGADSPGGRTVMQGGSGADDFVFPAHGDSTARIRDFAPGEDRLVFDYGSYRLGAEELRDVAVMARAPAVVRVLHDDDHRLDFTYRHAPMYPELHRLVYERESGRLWSLHDDRERWADRKDAGTDWRLVARFDGAPDLGLEDFLIYT